MDSGNTNLIKSREIDFCAPYPEKDHSREASLIVVELEGVHSVNPITTTQLSVSYDVSLITLQVIEEILTELGHHLSNRLFHKLKRALYYYIEETERINLGLKGSCKDCHTYYINRYQRLRHGCRDERPEHWRNYR